MVNQVSVPKPIDFTPQSLPRVLCPSTDTLILVVILCVSSSFKCSLPRTALSGLHRAFVWSLEVLLGLLPLKPRYLPFCSRMGEFAQPVAKMLSTGLIAHMIIPHDCSTFNNLISKELSLELFKESEIDLSLAKFHLSVVRRKTFLA